eukprot:405783-Prymnesium_polylepis.2
MPGQSISLTLESIETVCALVVTPGVAPTLTARARCHATRPTDGRWHDSKLAWAVGKRSAPAPAVAESPLPLAPSLAPSRSRTPSLSRPRSLALSRSLAPFSRSLPLAHLERVDER